MSSFMFSFPDKQFILYLVLKVIMKAYFCNNTLKQDDSLGSLVILKGKVTNEMLALKHLMSFIYNTNCIQMFPKKVNQFP